MVVCETVFRHLSALLMLKGMSKRPEFWETKLFGVEPIFCSNWEEGLQQMQTLFEKDNLK